MMFPPIKALLFFLAFGLLFSCQEGAKTGTEEPEAPSNEQVETPEATTAGELLQEERDTPFQIESGILAYEEKNLAGELQATYLLYFADYGMRVQLEETRDGETSIYAYDENLKKGATKFGGRDRVNKIFARQGEISQFLARQSTSGFAQLTDENLLGKTCEVWANNATDENGNSKMKFWLHQGIYLKVINRLGSGYQYEATSLEEKELDEGVFAILESVK